MYTQRGPVTRPAQKQEVYEVKKPEISTMDVNGITMMKILMAEYTHHLTEQFRRMFPKFENIGYEIPAKIVN